MGINRDKVLKNAEKLVQKGKIEQAIKEYEKLLKDNPGDANTINRVGDLYGRIGQVDKAIELYEQISEIFSKDGFFTKAIAILKKINRLAPNRLDIFQQLAELYTQQGLMVEAKSQYQMLAEWYIRQEDLDNAIKVHRRLVELDPGNHVANLRLADLLMQKGEKDEALEQYDRLGKILLDRDKLEEAERLYRHVLEQSPPTGHIFVPFLKRLVQAGRSAAAQEFLASALEGSPENKDLQLINVQVLLGLGETARATALAERLLAEEPDNAELREMVGDAMVASGEAARGRDLLLPVIDEHLNKGEFGKAQELLQGLLRTMLQDPQVLARAVRAYEHSGDQETFLTFKGALADAHFRAGHREKAQKLYMELVEAQSDNQLFRERLAQLGGAPAAGPEPAAPEAPVEASDEAPEEAVEIDADSFEPLELTSPEEAESAGFSFGSGNGTTEVPEEFATAADEDEEELELTSPGVEAAKPQAEAPAPTTKSALAARERLTEASVFAKYGLVDKAIRHLEEILADEPQLHEAREKLLSLQVEQGALDEARKLAPELARHYRDVGNDAALSALERSLGPVEPAAEVEPGADDLEIVEIELPEEEAAESEVVVLDDADLEPAEQEMELEFVDLDAEEGTVEEAPQPEPSFEAVEEASQPEPSLEAVEEGTPTAEAEPEPTGRRESEMDLLFEEPKPKKPSGESLDQLVLPDLEELERSVFGRESAGPQSAQTVQEAPAAPSQAPPPSHEAEPAAPEPPAEAEADGEMVELIDSAATPLVAELEQIDFFIEQELYDDALRMLAQLEQQYPEDGDVRERRLLLKSKGILLEDVALDSGSTPSEEALFADEEGFVDLAAELEQELAEEDAMVEEATGHGHEEAQLSEVFREFQKGVAEQLSEEDSDTHFNLGIAYKEMGLLSEAIGEFQISSRNDEFFVSACSMIGVCYLEMGMPQQAAEWYRKALTLESMTQDDRLGILYDLGSALETAGEIEEAYATFSEILAINPAFRDVQVRLKQLDASSGSQRQVN